MNTTHNAQCTKCSQCTHYLAHKLPPNQSKSRPHPFPQWCGLMAARKLFASKNKQSRAGCLGRLHNRTAHQKLFSASSSSQSIIKIWLVQKSPPFFAIYRIMPGKYVTKSSKNFLGFFTTPISVAWFTPKPAIWNISSLSIVSQKLRSSHLKAAPITKETTFIFSSHFLWITLFGIFLGFEELQKCLSNWNRHKLIDSFNIYTNWYPPIPMISTNTNDIH